MCKRFIENGYVAVVILQVGLCLYSYYLVTKGQALSLPNNRYIFTVANLRHFKKIRYLRDMLPMRIELAQGNRRYLGRKVTIILECSVSLSLNTLR
ncbi:hypothetical protein [Escherichia phage M01]|nr:hypothetical protein [Escherichia phage M01]